jgi:hypothetical protein
MDMAGTGQEVMIKRIMEKGERIRTTKTWSSRGPKDVSVILKEGEGIL